MKIKSIKIVIETEETPDKPSEEIKIMDLQSTNMDFQYRYSRDVEPVYYNSFGPAKHFQQNGPESWIIHITNFMAAGQML